MPSIIKERNVVSSSTACWKGALQQATPSARHDTNFVEEMPSIRSQSTENNKKKKKKDWETNMFRFSVLCLFFCLTYLLVGRSVIKQIYWFLCVRFQPIATGENALSHHSKWDISLAYRSPYFLRQFPQQNEFDSNKGKCTRRRYSTGSNYFEPNYLGIYRRGKQREFIQRTKTTYLKCEPRIQLIFIRRVGLPVFCGSQWNRIDCATLKESDSASVFSESIELYFIFATICCVNRFECQLVNIRFKFKFIEVSWTYQFVVVFFSSNRGNADSHRIAGWCIVVACLLNKFYH